MEGRLGPLSSVVTTLLSAGQHGACSDGAAAEGAAGSAAAATALRSLILEVATRKGQGGKDGESAFHALQPGRIHGTAALGGPGPARFCTIAPALSPRLNLLPLARKLGSAISP